MSLVIFSHTDYSYLWPIIEECMQPLLSALNPIFVCNKTEMSKPTGFVKYIEYDQTRCYAQRWTRDVLPHIDSKYILVVHDVSIIVNCGTEQIRKIFNDLAKSIQPELFHIRMPLTTTTDYRFNNRILELVNITPDNYVTTEFLFFLDVEKHELVAKFKRLKNYAPDFN